MRMRWVAQALLVVFIALGAGLPPAKPDKQATGGVPELSVAPVEGQVLRGAPVFLSAMLRNKSDRDLHLWLADGRLREGGWRMELAGSKDQPFRSVRMYRMTRDSFLPEATVLLAPGEQMRDYLTVWFGAYGDVPGERPLVFSPWGEFRYRIVFGLAEGPDKREAERLTFTAEGKVLVSSKEPPGLSPFVRCVREVVDEPDLFVDHRNRPRLEALVEELGDSPYAKYAKWLWIRSIFRDGQNDEGDFVLGGDSDQAREARERLQKFYKDLLADPNQPDTPIVWDALAAKALDEKLSHRPDETEKTLDELERRFGPVNRRGHWALWAY